MPWFLNRTEPSPRRQRTGRWLAPLQVRLLILALCAGLALTVAGCRVTTLKFKSDAKIHSNQDIAANFEQMRLFMRAQVQPLSDLIVTAADQIIAGTTNRAIQRQALLWKIDAVPSLRQALFRPNPLGAVLDAWVMAFQMDDYFAKGAGKDALGDSHPIAVQACRHLETALAAIATSFTISKDISHTRSFAQQWAAEHPIRGSIAGRETTVNRVIGNDVITSLSTGEALANVTVSLDDLQRRLEIYSAQLPEQARWETELVALEQNQALQLQQVVPLAGQAVKSIDSAGTSVGRLVPAVERVAAVAENTPKLMAEEREAAVKAIQAELNRALAFVHEERVAVLTQLTAERIAVLQEMRDVVRQEHQAVLPDLDRTGVKLADYVLLRTAELAAACLAAGFIGGLLLLYCARRLFARSKAQGQ
jgi:hypothetical protein